MFKAVIGDMFESNAQTLVNTVNCVGIMGKGVAQEFKRRFPAMFEDYKARCDRHQVKLGEPYIYKDLSGLMILNFPTKDHWRSPSRLSSIESGLDFLIAHASKWGITSIAMPPLGCGNGGLEWSEVGPLIFRKMKSLPIDVELYAPYGTPKSELGEEFLGAPVQMSLDDKGRKADKFRPEWAILVEILRELQQQPYANPVGRTIFQKICYIVTEMGIPTGFTFGKGSYGPFSEDVGKALHVFANKNWLQEEQLGRMIAMRVTPQFDRDAKGYIDYINANRKKIDKAVDLFSRIKSTEQAEEVMTVLYASRQLKQTTGDDVDEQQLFDYIINWKKSWNREEKKIAVANSIRHLIMLGWMRVAPSDSVLTPA
ncbi:type II toxin-antitoxin system antitoxin DNA ADP-ribosyl glycohydrolase DarG [Burkholderia gladioli]|uniref:type II toxin-antitoxin system antitoxin DNA ADP-ribosyl glycohydrolase DarG n=1 Tax=Burkholderia gladioli TaxID=28095 RepID=UPI001640B454|nr:macro domain-containing protein [Burkholderia gladioli]